MQPTSDEHNADWPLLIAGLGNSLLTDDGVGVHAVRLLRQAPPPRTHLLEVGTDLFSALPWLEKARRVLAIDAMEAGHPPGTIYECHGRDIAQPGQMTSLHELGLASVLEFLPEDKRPDITVLGIQPERIDYGLELTPTLQQVLPKVADIARRMILEWQE